MAAPESQAGASLDANIPISSASSMRDCPRTGQFSLCSVTVRHNSLSRVKNMDGLQVGYCACDLSSAVYARAESVHT